MFGPLPSRLRQFPPLSKHLTKEPASIQWALSTSWPPLPFIVYRDRVASFTQKKQSQLQLTVWQHWSSSKETLPTEGAKRNDQVSSGDSESHRHTHMVPTGNCKSVPVGSDGIPTWFLLAALAIIFHIHLLVTCFVVLLLHREKVVLIISKSFFNNFDIWKVSKLNRKKNKSKINNFLKCAFTTQKNGSDLKICLFQQLCCVLVLVCRCCTCEDALSFFSHRLLCDIFCRMSRHRCCLALFSKTQTSNVLTAGDAGAMTGGSVACHLLWYQSSYTFILEYNFSSICCFWIIRPNENGIKTNTRFTTPFNPNPNPNPNPIILSPITDDNSFLISFFYWLNP